MRVLFISEYFPPEIKGGGEISCFLLAKYLSQKGIEVHVLTSKFKNKNKKVLDNGIIVHRILNTGKNPSSLLSNIKRTIIFPSSVKEKTNKLLKKYKFDLIHYFNVTSIDGTIQTNIPKIMHLNSPIIFSPEATKKNNIIKNYEQFNKSILGSKKIGKIKNYWFLKHNLFFKKLLYYKFKKRLLNLKEINFFIPISNNLRNNLKKIGINKEKIKVLPNIIEINKFIKNKSSKNKLKIIYLGEYIEFKGVFDLLNSLKDLKRSYFCNFYGSGSEKNKILNFVKVNKLNVKINKKISHKKVSSILSKHNILVFHSKI